MACWEDNVAADKEVKLGANCKNKVGKNQKRLCKHKYCEGCVVLRVHNDKPTIPRVMRGKAPRARSPFTYQEYHKLYNDPDKADWETLEWWC
jgi:hypothetical protein